MSLNAAYGHVGEAQRSPSAAAEERSDEGTASKRSALAAVGCKAGLGVNRHGSQIGSIPCALITGIAAGPLRNLSKSRAASGAVEVTLTAPPKLV